MNHNFLNIQRIELPLCNGKQFNFKERKNIMKNNKANKRLLYSCPHCNQEYVIIGIDIDFAKSDLCSVCGGYYELVSMSKKETKIWINRYLQSEES